MGKEPEISVIMGIYNQNNRDWLEQAINSILCQTFTDFEFIIYDDGSDQQIKNWLYQYARMDDRIRIISNDTNHGLAYSLNSCIDVAKGRYLARMDDDDISLPNRFMIQHSFLEEHSEYAFVGCGAKLMDDSGIWGTRIMTAEPGERDFMRFSPYIHPTVMIRKSVFHEADNLYRDAKDTLRCEDYELFMRLWKKGYKGFNLQEALFVYREDKSAYDKRKFTYRVDEMKLRYRSFKELGMLFPIGWIYVLRPLIAALVPSKIILKTKRLYHKYRSNEVPAIENTVNAISKELEKLPKAI